MQKDKHNRKEQKLSSRLSILIPIEEIDQIDDFPIPGSRPLDPAIKI